MRQTFRQFSCSALATVVSLTLTQAVMGAQQPQVAEGTGFAQESADALQSEELRRFAGNARKIEGVWEAQVTRRVCGTGDPITTFRGMTNFIQGGSVIGTNSNPNPPTTYGRWQYLGKRRFVAVERFFRYNPDASFAGVQRITRTITLSADGNHFTGVNTAEVFDVDGNLIGTGCSTDETVRVE
jgi:hypothetical protein